MSARQRRKGAAGEREVCAQLARFFGTEVKRHLGQARDGGEDITFGGITWEVKRRKSLKTVYDWMRQVEKAAQPTGNLHAVVFRADNEDWVAMVPLEQFIYMAEGFIRRNINQEELHREISG